MAAWLGEALKVFFAIVGVDGAEGAGWTTGGVQSRSLGVFKIGGRGTEEVERKIGDSLLRWLGFDKPPQQRVRHKV